MQQTFQFATKFNGDISEWDVSVVTSLDQTFHGAVSFKKPLTHWQTQDVQSMYCTFKNAEAIDGPLRWNVARVSSMERSFLGAKSYNGDVGSWTFSPDVSSLDYCEYSQGRFIASVSISGRLYAHLSDLLTLYPSPVSLCNLCPFSPPLSNHNAYTYANAHPQSFLKHKISIDIWAVGMFLTLILCKEVSFFIALVIFKMYKMFL